MAHRKIGEMAFTAMIIEAFFVPMGIVFQGMKYSMRVSRQ